MKLSIITINYNDAKGLAKTLKSVAEQTGTSTTTGTGLEVEHIIVDGGSTDESVDVIKDYLLKIVDCRLQIEVKWVSERDNGVYNAMNKGIRMATGDYIQILNSGDVLAAPDVLSRMFGALQKANSEAHQHEVTNTQSSTPEVTNIKSVDLIYGNMLVDSGEGSFAESREVEYSLRQYYSSTMNHDCCWIKRYLFEEYGLYDENLRIVSDWKWFLQTIGLGRVRPVYVDIDMTIFSGGGISSVQVEKRNAERRKVLEEVMPPAVLADYNKHAFDMHQMDNLRKHPWAYKLVWILERVLNRLDNRNFRKPKK